MKSRPFGVTLLAWIVLLFTVVNLARLVQSISGWKFWAELLPIWPGYLVLTGLGWFLMGVIVARGVFRARPWARWLTPVIFVLYSANLWIERLFLSGNRERNENWLFAAGLTLLVVLLCARIMSGRRAKDYFEEQNGRKPDNQSIV